MTQMIQVHDQPHMLAASGLHVPAIATADGLMGCCSIFASPARVQADCSLVQPAHERIKILGCWLPLDRLHECPALPECSQPT